MTPSQTNDGEHADGRWRGPEAHALHRAGGNGAGSNGQGEKATCPHRGAKLPAIAWRGSRGISSRMWTRPQQEGYSQYQRGIVATPWQSVQTGSKFPPPAHEHAAMTDQPNNPLHGITLESMLTELVERYGWDSLGNQVNIRCFQFEPSIKSSLKFLRRTPWARAEVEALYLRQRR
jgi:hypothetical protein